METLDLQFVELDEEPRDEVFKDIVAVVEQLGGLLICQNLLDVLVGPLEVREEENEHFLLITRNLNKVDLLFNVVEVSIQHFSCGLDPEEAVADVHGRGPLFCDDVQA